MCRQRSSDAGGYDITLIARSENVSGQLLLSGNIDIGKLNDEIDKIYNLIGIKKNAEFKLKETAEGKASLMSSQVPT